MHILQGESDGRLVKDHALPLRILRLKLLDAGIAGRDEIRAYLLRFYRLGLITKEEDDRLNDLRLRQSLPKDSDELEWLARYKHAGIRTANAEPTC